MNSIIPLDPSNYQRHSIHGDDRCWTETNCYVDVLIELIHGLGFEPIAALPFTFGIDFEGDQWTFFKYPHSDLLQLYGFDIQELNPWNSLAHHVQQQIDLKRPVLVELDSYFLPDTAGTAYRIEHVKSTVAVNAIDVDTQTMSYFHGQGYYQLSGQDFIDVYQLDGLVHERMLPPYIEYIKLRHKPEDLSNSELMQRSLYVLKKHLGLLPQTNPFLTFKQRFNTDLQWLMSEPLDTFHKYSFATLRQYGACFELAQTYLQWLQQNGEQKLENCIDHYYQIANTAKTLQFQLARSMARNKPLDLQAIDTMALHWENGTKILLDKYL